MEQHFEQFPYGLMVFVLIFFCILVNMVFDVKSVPIYFFITNIFKFMLKSDILNLGLKYSQINKFELNSVQKMDNSMCLRIPCLLSNNHTKILIFLVFLS